VTIRPGRRASGSPPSSPLVPEVLLPGQPAHALARPRGRGAFGLPGGTQPADEPLPRNREVSDKCGVLSLTAVVRLPRGHPQVAPDLLQIEAIQQRAVVQQVVAL